MTKLIAPEGYYYTDGETTSQVVCLGINADENDWYLVPISSLTSDEEKLIALGVTPTSYE